MELYQIKRELITDFLKQKMPITVNAKKPLSWWLEQKFAREEDLELVTK
jgi:hypothetical protein